MMTTHFSSESGQAVRSPKVPSAAPPPYYINNFVFGEIKRIGSRGRRFPMRRGGPYLSACVRGGSTRFGGTAQSRGIVPPLRTQHCAPRKNDSKKDRKVLLVTMHDHKIWIRPPICCTTAPSTPLPLQELYSLLFRKKGSGSGLICYAAGSGAAARVCSLPFCWSYMAEKSCFPPSRQHFRFTTASSSALFTHLLPGELEARSLFKHFSC